MLGAELAKFIDSFLVKDLFLGQTKFFPFYPRLGPGIERWMDDELGLIYSRRNWDKVERKCPHVTRFGGITVLVGLRCTTPLLSRVSYEGLLLYLELQSEGINKDVRLHFFIGRVDDV